MSQLQWHMHYPPTSARGWVDLVEKGPVLVACSGVRKGR